MKAMVIREFGSPQVFQPLELEKPIPAPGELLLRVLATSVNPIDLKIRSKGMGLAPEFPAVLHGDVSGLVEARGPGATRFEIGQAVFGLGGGIRGRDGALAEYMRVDERLLAAKPDCLSFGEAAALPVAGLTAHEALLIRAPVGRGSRILVQGGAGGVGSLALQIAHSLGADMVSTASAAHCGLLQELGCREAIDYRRPELEEALGAASGGEGFDLVLDTVGGASLDLAFRLARPGGSVCAIAARSTHDLSPLHGKGLSLHVIFTLLPLLSGRNIEGVGERLGQLAQFAERGLLLPRLHPRIYRLEEVAQAHELLESGKNEGKISISVANEG